MKKGKIPEGWERIKLKEVLREVTERNKDEKIKRVLSVTNSQGFVNQEEYFEGTVHSNNISNYKIIRKNQFAYNPSRVNVGSIDVLKKYDEGVLSPMYVVFEVDETRVLPEYFKYYFETYRFLENVKKNTQGTVRDSLNFNSLVTFDYLLPPLKEQYEIVQRINQVDSIIKLITSKIENLNNERVFVKKRMFNSVINNSEKKKLSDLFERVTEKNLRRKSENVLTISAQHGLINQKDFFNKLVVGSNLEGYYLIKKGDFVYNKSYSNGYPVGATKRLKLYDSGIVSTLYICFRSKNKNIHEGFFEYVFESEYYYKELEKITQEGNRNHGILNMGIQDFFNIKVEVPKYELQEKIYKVMFGYDEKIQQEARKKQEYEKLKIGLMQQLLTGKVRVII